MKRETRQRTIDVAETVLQQRSRYTQSQVCVINRALLEGLIYFVREPNATEWPPRAANEIFETEPST